MKDDESKAENVYVYVYPPVGIKLFRLWPNISVMMNQVTARHQAHALWNQQGLILVVLTGAARDEPADDQTSSDIKLWHTRSDPNTCAASHSTP